jgi:outer membrane protein TolC
LVALLVFFSGRAFSASQIDENPSPGVLRLTLQDAIAQALSHNRLLRTSGYGVRNRDLSVAAAQSALDLKIKPLSTVGTSDDGERLTGGVDLSKTFETGIRASLSPEFGRVEGDFRGEIAARLEIPLFKGLGHTVTLDKVNGSRFALRSARRAYYLSRVKTVLDTVSAVYDVVRQKHLMDQFQARITSLEHHLQDVRLRQRVGIAGRLDVYRADIQRSNVQDSLTLAREGLQNATDRLKLILAISQSRPLSVSAPLDIEPLDLNTAQAVEIALRQRVELRQAEDAVGEARRQADVARENLLPGLNLVAAYVSSRSSVILGDIFRPSDARWAVGLTGATDWARRAEKMAYRQRLNDVQAAQLKLRHSREEVGREVRQQLDALQRARRRIDIQRAQIHQAEGKRALAAVKFRHNMASNFDVMDADRDLQRARTSLLNARIDYIVGIYRLRRALGTLLKD